MTLFSLLLSRCGLSIEAAAQFLNVRSDTVKSWSSGRRQPPEAVVTELRLLFTKIERTADEAAALFKNVPPDAEIELGFAADDHEAQSLGWPCAGAQYASLGTIAARSHHSIRLVPRASTSATAAAVDAHENKLKRL
jgi:hypothetical protein